MKMMKINKKKRKNKKIKTNENNKYIIILEMQCLKL